MGTIANVLTGVATLGVRQPNDANAEWSSEHYQGATGAYSVKLSKGGTGNEGSTHIEIIPPTGTTMTLWTAGIATNSFYHHSSAVPGNYAQFEFKFEDPNSVYGWAEITLVPLQGDTPTGGWEYEEMANGTSAGYGGHTEINTPFSEWGLINANLVEAAIATLDANACTPGDWILTRVRIQLWEPTPERHSYIDTIEIMGTTYTIEPGGTAPGMSLSSPYTDVGYTEDGVTMEYTADTADIEVEEETFPIGRVITKETVAVTCNMAESSLSNIDNAMAGSLLSGSILKLGAGTMKTMNIKIAGTNPAGFNREIFIPLATSTGAVGMSYKKGEKTIVPVTFQALKSTGQSAVIIVDNAE